MKKIFSLLLVVAMILSLCACGGGNEYNPNEGKILITDKLKTEMEEYLTIPHKTIKNIKNAEWEFIRRCKVYSYDYDVNFDSCEIKSYEQKDEYNYIVYVVFNGKDKHNDIIELKTSLLLFFEDDSNENKHKINDDYTQFEKDLKNLNS